MWWCKWISAALLAVGVVCGVRSSDAETKTLRFTPTEGEDQPMKTYSSCMYLRDEGTWNTWAEWGASIGKGKVSLDTLVSDLNRNAPAIASSATPMAPSGAYLYGYTWESGDQSVEYWVPQGMTQGKIGDYYYAITSWYYNSDAPSGDPNPPVSPYSNKGVRISIANISQTSAGVTTQYRHLLLVHPTGTGTYEPVVNHAGGVVWIKNFLYLADTNNGMRVFDLSDIRAMSTDDTCSDKIGQVSTGVWCAYGYKYAVPELTKYLVSKIDNSSLPDTDVCFAKFSWLGKDSTQTQGVILSGEYCNDGSSPCTADPASAPGMGGRMYRWPYDSNGKLIAGDSGLVVAERAYTMNKRNVQGAAPVVQTSDRDDYRLASSRDYGSLFLVSLTIGWKEYDVGASTWSYYPEGTYASTTGSGHLWLVNEGREKSDGSYYTSPRDGGRALYAVDSDNMYNP